MRLHLTVLTVFLALLLACAAPPQEAAGDTTAPPDTAALREARDAHNAAAAAGDVDGYLAIYADDAVWMPPQVESIVGKAAARQKLQGVFEDVSVELEAMTEELVVLSPEWVMDRGSFVMTRTPKAGGDPEEAAGTYMTLWRLGADGSWKVAYDIWNSDRPYTGGAQ